MDAGRLVVTLLGLGLIVAVNLYFFARPRAARAPAEPARPGVEPAAGPADEARGGR